MKNRNRLANKYSKKSKINSSFFKKITSKRTTFILVVLLILSGISYGVYSWYVNRYQRYISIYNNYVPQLAPGDRSQSYVNLGLEQSFNIVVVGLDRKESGHIKADCILIVHYNPVSSHYQIFEIPEDVSYFWPEKDKYLELSNIYALGQLNSPESGMTSVIDTIEYNLALKIDGYVSTDFIGFEMLVDKMDTLSVQNNDSFIDEDLKKLNLTDSFDSGTLKFDKGNDLLAYIMSDSGGYNPKIRRHYTTFQSILNSIDIDSIYKTLGDKDRFENHFFSNIEGDSIRNIISNLLSAESLKVTFYEPPSSIVSLYESDEGAVTILNKAGFDNFIFTTFENEDIVREQARVEIYNATDVSGLASKYSRLLVNMGCDVIRVANINENVNQTVIFVKDINKYPQTISLIKKVVGENSVVTEDVPVFPTTGDIILVVWEEL